MSAFQIVASGQQVISVEPMLSRKTMILRVKGTASYDTGGSVLDLSSTSALFVGSSLAPDGGFTAVHGVRVIGVEAAGGAVYAVTYLRDTAGAPATGKLVLYLGASATQVPTQASSTTDISATIFILEIVGK